MNITENDSDVYSPIMNTTYRNDEILYAMNGSGAMGQNITSADDMVMFFKLSETEKICAIIVIILIVPVIIIGIFGNLTVCWVVATVKKLQTPANIQLVMLAVVDFANCIIPAPILLFRAVYVLMHANALSIDDTIYNVGFTPLCHILRFVQYCAVGTSTCMITSLSITRAMGMSGKFSREVIKRCFIASMIACTLFGSGVAFGLTISSASCDTMIDDLTFRKRLQKTFDLFLMGSMIISQIMVTTVYVGITIVKKRHRNATKEIFKNISKSLDKRDLATIRICFILVTFIFVSYLPIIFTVALRQSDLLRVKIDFLYTWIQIAIVFANSAINPVVYALMSNNFRSNLCFVRRRRLQKEPKRQKGKMRETTDKILELENVISDGKLPDVTINDDLNAGQDFENVVEANFGNINIGFQCD
ncbi:melatonin receptor type 1A-A-like [Glandiceps talaboti]